MKDDPVHDYQLVTIFSREVVSDILIRPIDSGYAQFIARTNVELPENWVFGSVNLP